MHELEGIKLSTGETAEVIGIDAGLFERWVSRGIWRKPTKKGRGKYRSFTADQAVGFALVASLVEYGLPVSITGQIVRALDWALQVAGQSGVVIIRRDQSKDRGGIMGNGPMFVAARGWEAAVVTGSISEVVNTSNSVAILVDVVAIEQRVKARIEAMSRKADLDPFTKSEEG